MSLLYWDKEQNTLEIKDEGKQQKNGLILILVINFLNAIINSLRLFKEEFSFMHGIWISLGILTIIMLFDFRKRDFSDSISINSILNYKHKKNFLDSTGQLVLHLNNKKRRTINIVSKKQIDEFEILFQELNIPKHDSTKEIIY
ncbi:hypothetical protein [Flavobacterium sp.]|uniref:hypothetical protein n=2 Tax=Flavobacterium sp. TaxID=239 RepID=UPI00404817B9